MTFSGVFRNVKRGAQGGGTEGPERGAYRREAPERRGGWGLGRGAVAPPQYGGLGAMPPENFKKIKVEIAYFSAFLQAEMVSSAVAQGRIRQ